MCGMTQPTRPMKGYDATGEKTVRPTILQNVTVTYGG